MWEMWSTQDTTQSVEEQAEHQEKASQGYQPLYFDLKHAEKDQ